MSFEKRCLEVVTNAKLAAHTWYMLYGADLKPAAEEALKSCHLPELSVERALWVGAFIDTVDRIRQKGG